VTNLLLEYIWLDGYATPNMRSKVKVLALDAKREPTIEDCPVWNFDGSSTKQAPGHSSECLLHPARLYHWKDNHYFVLCEVMNEKSAETTGNRRADLRKQQKDFEKAGFWWGFEQEYFITKDFIPLGFPKGGYPKPQGLYYCGVGGNQVRGRELAEKHLHKCLEMGIMLTGTNAEVAVGQWEFQCFAQDTLKACDDLWMSRYVLYRLAEEYSCDINLEPKPIHGDWNGSGCHTNFSNEKMRNEGGEAYFKKILENLSGRHLDHIKSYGENNDQRLTGDHETQHIGQFSWGVGDRGASIRVPNAVKEDGWKGYLEDRRPASNCDPYIVASMIVAAVEK
jgi:glutamine synthetase